jgi:TolB protein
MKRLTTNGDYNDWPSWTPDGRHIVFSSYRKKTRDIWKMRADGTHERRIGKYPRGDEFYPIVSPNGRWIAYSGDTNNLLRENTSLDVWVMNRRGNKRRRLTRFDYKSHNADEYVSDWSPDGKRILFNRWIRGDQDREFERELFSIRVDGTGLHRITDTPNHDEEWATWSPDGRWIIYAITTTLYRIPATGGEPRAMQEGGGSSPDWQAR